MTDHATRTAKVYLAVVGDTWSYRIVGWYIADHMRADVVVDAITVAPWHHGGDGHQPAKRWRIPITGCEGNTFWAFGQRLRAA